MVTTDHSFGNNIIITTVVVITQLNYFQKDFGSSMLQ